MSKQSVHDLWAVYDLLIHKVTPGIKPEDALTVLKDAQNHLPPTQLAPSLQGTVKVLTKLYQEAIDGFKRTVAEANEAASRSKRGPKENKQGAAKPTKKKAKPKTAQETTTQTKAQA